MGRFGKNSPKLLEAVVFHRNSLWMWVQKQVLVIGSRCLSENLVADPYHCICHIPPLGPNSFTQSCFIFSLWDFFVVLSSFHPLFFFLSSFFPSFFSFTLFSPFIASPFPLFQPLSFFSFPSFKKNKFPAKLLLALQLHTLFPPLIGSYNLERKIVKNKKTNRKTASIKDTT